MQYDIPPPLQHKEKIFWNMTFSDLAYASPAALIIGATLKSSLSMEVKGSISLFIVILAAFFIRFDGLNRIRNITKHLTNQDVEVHSDTLKKLVDIKEIKEIVKTSSKDLAILEVIPMNFMLKTEEEKESIIKGFQKFLNSLDFPIQIHISSSIVSLDKHLEILEKRTKELPELFKSYKDFLLTMLKDNGVKNRKFYIIIQEKENLEIQTKVCQQKLQGLGLKVRQLSESSLLQLFHEYIANRKKKELKEDQTVENFTHFLASPEKITFFHDYFQVDDLFCKTIAVTGYPFSVEEGFLDGIISSSDSYDISIHIDPFPIETTMVQLNRELQKQQADLYADSKKGIINPSLEIKYKSTRQVLEDLQKGKQKLFNVSLYIMCKGSKDQKQAVLLAKKVKADLDGLMIQSKIPTFQMMDSYQSMLPLARNPLKVQRNVHTQGLSAFFPFSSPFLDIENDGILLGLNKNRIPYIKNVFSLTNANGIILATSGSGKSYFTKLMISRQFMNGCEVVIIDPQGEYLAITEHYKGETITISKNSDTIINPLDLMGHEYLEKRLSLMDLFQIMFGDLNELQKSILDRAVDLMYARKDINRDSWKGKKPPKMEDLYKELKELDSKAGGQERVTYRAILNRLAMYTDRGVFSFLNRDTNINFDNKFVCFNIGAMPKQVKPVIMYLVLDYIYMKMKKNLKRKLLVIDEAWSMLQRAEESSYVFEIVKTCRKYNLGLLMITQDVADLIASKAGHAVLANTSYTFLLRQKPAVMKGVSSTFNLSEAERDYLVTAEKGSGILILENEHQEIEVVASKKEHELITTNPDEMVANSEKKKGKKDDRPETSITLDIEKDVYVADSLSLEQRNFLSNNGYKLGCFHDLGKKKQREYLVKQRLPESLIHTFNVDLIFKVIRKQTDKVEIFRTVKPDIVFVNKRGEEIAIEVETAIGVKNKKKYHNEKFAVRKKQFGSRCYVYVIESNMKNSYARHGLPILFRSKILEFILAQFSGKSNHNIVEDLDKAE